MLKKCLMENKIPTLWRQSKLIAILKHGKDSTIPKSYRPIYILCHTYNLYERMILYRIAPTIEEQEQAGFRLGKSCTSQLLNLTQHIDDGYQESITGTAFVDMSATYDTMHHRPLIQTLFNITQDSTLCRVIHNLLLNRKFYVELNNEADGVYRRMACHKGVFPPQLFSTYTPMISQSMMEQGASSTQMTCAY